MVENQIPLKPIIVSSLVSGVAVGALEYATFNRRLYNSGKLSGRQVGKIAESLAEKFPEQETKILSLKENPRELYGHFVDLYKKCCDDTGKLVHDSKKISKEYFDVIKTSLNKLRVQQSLVFGGLFALGCAAVSLITNKITAKKATHVGRKG